VRARGPEAFCEAAAGLSNLVPRSEREALFAEAHRATALIDTCEKRVKALVTLGASYKDQSDRLIEEATGITTAEFWVSGKAASLLILAPLLQPAERNTTILEALSAIATDFRLPVVGLNPDSIRLDIFKSLASVIPADLLSVAVKSAMLIKTESFRLEALLSLAPHLRSDELLKGLDQAVSPNTPEHERIKSVISSGGDLSEIAFKLIAEDTSYQPTFVEGLANRLSNTARSSILQMLLRSRDSGRRMSSLAGLCVHLNSSDCQLVVDAICESFHHETASYFSVLLIQKIGQYLRPHNVEQLWPLVTGRGELLSRLGILDTLAPHLSKRQLEMALDLAREIADDLDRSSTLASLSRYLSGVAKEACIEAAVSAAMILDHPLSSFQSDGLQSAAVRAISLLASISPDYSVEKLSQLSRPSYRIAVLVAIWDQLKEIDRQILRDKFFHEVLDVGEDDLETVQSLNALGPFLSTDERTKWFSFTKRISNEWYRMQAYAGMAPYLRESELEQVLFDAEKMEPSHSLETYLALLPFCSRERQEGLKRRLVELFFKMPVSLQTAMRLEKLAQWLPQTEVDRILSFVPNIHDYDIQAAIIRFLAPLAPLEAKNELARTCLQETKKAMEGPPELINTLIHTRVFGAIAPHLTAGNLAEAYSLCHKISSPSKRLEALFLLMPFLDNQRVLCIVEEAIGFAEQVVGGYSGNRIEQAITPIKDRIPRSKILNIAASYFEKSARNPRDTVFRAIGLFAPDLFQEEGEAGIRDILRSIDEAVEMYP
jgi:hypothetical protein